MTLANNKEKIWHLHLVKFYAITEMKKMEWKSHMIKPAHEIQMGIKNNHC